jgi:hypothetical protein
VQRQCICADDQKAHLSVAEGAQQIDIFLVHR